MTFTIFYKKIFEERESREYQGDTYNS